MTSATSVAGPGRYSLWGSGDGITDNTAASKAVDTCAKTGGKFISRRKFLTTIVLKTNVTLMFQQMRRYWGILIPNVILTRMRDSFLWREWKTGTDFL